MWLPMQFLWILLDVSAHCCILVHGAYWCIPVHADQQLVPDDVSWYVTVHNTYYSFVIMSQPAVFNETLVEYGNVLRQNVQY